MAIVKKRHWAFVAYPESLPENWLEILSQSGVGVAISPLHNKDLDPTGEEKKEHYHVIVSYEGPTTFKNVNQFTNSLNATIPIALESPKGMYRYFTHRDNPDKYQYDEKDIICYNFDPNSFISNSEISQIKYEISNMIIEFNIQEYCDLLDYLKTLDDKMYWEIASNCTVFFNTYLTSKRNKAKEELRS